MNATCIKCGNLNIYCKGLCNKCYNHQYYINNKAKINNLNIMWALNNPAKRKDIDARCRRKKGILSMSENHECASYLGVHIAERVLSKVFNNVEIQPHGNPGFDFICNHGKKIDVKSACLLYNNNKSPIWTFKIKKNKIADYFLCLAFDNRKDLNPMHIWLIPASDINNKGSIAASTTTFMKWNKYALDIEKVSSCCNIMKEN